MSEKTGKNGASASLKPSTSPPPTTSSTAAAEDNPPSYDASPETELLQPETLLLAGTIIYGNSSADSPPLYELSYPIGHLRESNTSVSFERFEQRVRMTDQPDDPVAAAAAGLDDASQQVPRISTRKKHIYDLKRALAIRLTAPTFSYYLESLSRGNVGHLGLKTYRHRLGTALGYRAYHATRPKSHADLEPKDVAFVAKSRGKGKFEWRSGGSSGEDRLVAHETIEEGIYRLQIVESFTRKERDALVAMWCLRLWWEIASGHAEPLSWAEVKHTLQYHTKEFPIGTGVHV